MNELDHFVKQSLRWRDYIRYCDDFCLYGNNVGEIKRAAIKIREFISRELKIVFSHSTLRRTDDGVGFIGYRHFKKFVMLRSVSAKKIGRRISNIVQHNDFGVRGVGQLAAAYGWSKWACCYNWRTMCLNGARKNSMNAESFVRKTLMHDLCLMAI